MNLIQGNTITQEESFKYCERTAGKHYENFPVGSFLVPKDKRKYVWSIYAFARYADDIADSGEISPEVKLEKLNLLEEALLTFINTGNTGLDGEKYKFLPAISKTVYDLEIPVVELTNLLKAFKQDSIKQRYDTFDELLDYSQYSANPIGRLVLYIFGYTPAQNERLFTYSDSICTALQLTNFWQDVSVDLGIGRVYIPGQIMMKHNYSYEDLLEKKEDERFIEIMTELVEKTRRIFLHGEPLTKELKGRLRMEIKATYIGGNAILDKIESINYKVLSKKVKLGKRNKISMIIKTFFT